MIRVLLLADTHVGGHHPNRRLPEAVLLMAAQADAVLHAGDVTEHRVLDQLAALAPVHAVLGNNDVGLRLPERRIVALGGRMVAMVHDSGAAGGRGARLRRWFSDADVVVFGHSHLPWHEVDVRADGHRQLHVNPGSPTERRRAPHATAAWLVVDEDGTCSAEHVVIELS